MQKYNLGELPKHILNSVGGKARGLNKLIQLGYRVPPGFVLTDIHVATDLEEAAQEYARAALGSVAVRSSASQEDGEQFSYAGQFATVLNVETEEDFKAAVQQCVESLHSVTANAYESKLSMQNEDTTSLGMNVVVQKMLKPTAAGVCFTQDPSDKQEMLVEAVHGLGEALVSGQSLSMQYKLTREDALKGEMSQSTTEAIANNDSPLSATLLVQLAKEALQIEEAHGAPQDLEWAVQDGKIYWLQTRPITTTDAVSVDEFNPKHSIKGHAITKFNVGEMLPGAITPLSLSTTIYAIDWGIRRMMQLVGVNKKMQKIPELGCCFTVNGHFFMDLSQLYGIAHSTILAGKNNIDLSICDRVLSGEEEEGTILTPKKNIFARLHYSTKYIRFLMSHKKAKKRIAKLADTFAIEHDDTLEGLYLAIDKGLASANTAALLHYVTSGHGGAMSSATTNALDKRFKNPEKSRGVLAQMLERIEDIESVDILRSLERIAQAILQEQKDAKNFTEEELNQYLKTADGAVQTAVQYFMHRHGHRAIREAELRSKSWANDRSAFIKYLKTVMGVDMPKAETEEPNLKAILKENGFKGAQVGKIAYFAKQARGAVVNREFSKSKLIKIFDGLKSAYALLAEKLVNMGRLPDTDSIYFLTHQEIGDLVLGDGAALVKKALQRKRMLKMQETLTFKEVYNDMPYPIVLNYESGANGESLTGLPVSRGLVTGTARVVTSTSDAEKLQKGEIMVAQFTDIGWSPFYCLLDGLVTEVGSALSHGAVVAREYAIPLVSSIAGATKLIKTGDNITVDGFSGTVTINQTAE